MAEYINTGVFGSRRAPKVRGVSDSVAYSTTVLAQSASEEFKTWSRTLTKGQRRRLRRG